MPQRILSGSIYPVSIDPIIDLAPATAELRDNQPVGDWEGFSVTNSSISDRDHVLMDTFCGGNCLFEHRPIYMGVRSQDYLYLWKDHRDPDDKFAPEGNKISDLNTDPIQSNNIYHPSHLKIEHFDAIISARLREIPEYPTEKIDRYFGSDIKTDLNGAV